MSDGGKTVLDYPGIDQHQTLIDEVWKTAFELSRHYQPRMFQESVKNTLVFNYLIAKANGATHEQALEIMKRKK